MTDTLSELDNSNLDPKKVQYLKSEYERLNTKEEVKDSESQPATQGEVKEERVFTEFEKKQMARGWDPNKPDGYSAEVFAKIGDIILQKEKEKNRADSQSQKIEGLQSAVKLLLEQNKKVADLTWQEAAEKFKREKEAAIFEADVAKVEQIEKKAAEYYKQMQPVLQQPVIQDPVQQPYTQEQVDWAKENKDWFNPNNPKVVRAMSVAYDNLKAMDAEDGIYRSDKEVLEEAANTIKQMPRYSSYFKTSLVDKTKEAKISMVETPSRSGGTGTAPQYTLSDHDRVQLRKIQLADPSFKEADYAAMMNRSKGIK